MAGLELRQRPEVTQGTHILEVCGEVELANATTLRETLTRFADAAAQAGIAPRIVLEMSRVGFLDSSGVGVLVGGYKRMRSQDGALAIAAPHARVKRVLEIAGLMRALPIYDSVEEAVSAAANTKPGNALADDAQLAPVEGGVA